MNAYNTYNRQSSSTSSGEESINLEKLIKDEKIRCGDGGNGGFVEIIVDRKDLDLL